MNITGDDRAEEGAQMPMPWEPYREGRLARSAGRTLLSEAFSNYMALIAGISPLEIASAFDAGGNFDDRDLIQREIHFLAGIFVQGRIQTYARLAGGGDPIELSVSAWEIDDATPRFSTASLNLERPHDPLAAPTHWIFVDNAEWDAAMEGLRASRLPPLEEWHDNELESDQEPAITIVDSLGAANEPTLRGNSIPGSEPWRNEIMSLESVIKATGLKRSTIYAKVSGGSFPRQISIHGTRKGWRRGEVQDWLDGLAR